MPNRAVLILLEYRPQPRRYLDIRGPLKCPRGRNFKSRAKIRDVLKMARTNA